MLQVEILYPQPNTTVYGNEVNFRYKVLNNLEKYKTSKIVFSINNSTEIESDLNGLYSFTSLVNGEYEIVGYLKNKNGVKIKDTDFSVKFGIITQKYEPKNITWAFAKNKLPQFIQDDYKTFSRFIEAYYEWLHKSNNPIYAPFSSEFFADIDSTPEIFLSSFRTQYLNDFPDNIFELGGAKNLRTLVKNIKQFYRSKGSEKSFRFLFRLLYNTYVDFYYPKTDLIKASGNLWVENVGIKVKNIDVNVSFNLKNAVVYQVTGNIKTTSARVLSVNVQKEKNQSIIELFLANIVGVFDQNKPVYSDINIDGQIKTVEMDLLPVVTSINITGKGLKVGDKIYIKPETESTATETGSSFFAIVTDVGLKGNVKQINIINSGYNYSTLEKIYKKNPNETFVEISGNYTVGTLTRYPGYYKTISSSPSSRGKLQDNRKYQDLSYVLKVEDNIFKYADIVKRLVHPAGMGLFGSYLIKRTESLETNVKTNVNNLNNLYYRGFIGNYLPYNFDTTINLRNHDFGGGLTDLYPYGFDPTQPLPSETTPTGEHIPLPYNQINLGVQTLKFNYIPPVSDSNSINTYWVVFPHPNTLLNNLNSMKDIVIRDFLKIDMNNLSST